MKHTFSFLMPDIGEGVVEGEVISWMKNVGDTLQKDEPVIVMMTDKATVELPTPHSGKLLKQYYKPGDIARKGTPLFDVEVEGEGERKKEEVRSQKPEVSSQKSEESRSIHHSALSTHHSVLAAPYTRKLAKEMGIDLEQVRGTGKEGIITQEDLKRHVGKSEGKIERLPGDKERPLIGIHHKMAEKMAESGRQIPGFSYMQEIDAEKLIEKRDRLKKQYEGLTFMPFFIHALSEVIRKFPLINTSYEEGSNTLIERAAQNVGIAMSTPHGLIVPVMKGVEKMGLDEIIVAFEELKKVAKEQKFTSSMMKEGTITVTNFGTLGGGGLFATPVIMPPEVAILGLARIQPRATVYKGELAIRQILPVTWSFDHRVIDGELASQVASYFNTLLNPNNE